MAYQMDVETRNARGDAYETTVGTSPILKMRVGPVPANCAAADTGLVLATLNLPSDWMTNGIAGVKTKSGTWEDSGADEGGTVGHFRLYSADGTTCRGQGSVTATGGGGVMTVDNVVFAPGQAFTITSFTLTEANA